MEIQQSYSRRKDRTRRNFNEHLLKETKIEYVTLRKGFGNTMMRPEHFRKRKPKDGEEQIKVLQPLLCIS